MAPVDDKTKKIDDILKTISDLQGLDVSYGAVGSRVWFGYNNAASVSGGGQAASVGAGGRAENTLSLPKAIANIDSWSHQDLQKFAQALYAGGQIPAPVVNMKVLKQFWTEMVTQSAAFYKAGKRISPYQVLEMYMGQVDTSGSGAKPTVTLTDPASANYLLDQALASALGRDATEGEKRSFLSALNAAQLENPLTTTDVDGVSVTSGGVVPQTFTDDYVNRQFGKEAGTTQAATRYFNVFESILGGPSEGEHV